MAFYVFREGVRHDLLSGEPIPRNGWTGPIDDEQQAKREVEAWTSAGWIAAVRPDTATVRAEVAAWEATQVAAMRHSTDPSQQRRYWDSVRATNEED